MGNKKQNNVILHPFILLAMNSYSLVLTLNLIKWKSTKSSIV